MKSYFIYFVTNYNNQVLYVGVTSDLARRTFEHQTGAIEGFSQKYKTHKLVYYEEYEDIRLAIAREKQIKRWRREKKNKLVESMNPTWQNLAELLNR